MAGTDGGIVLTPDGSGNVSVSLSGIHVIKGDGEIPVAAIKSGDSASVTLKVDAPSGSIGPDFDRLAFVALLFPLILGTVVGAAVAFGLVRSLGKTLDKLAQLLSEDGSAKMSLSRVQALIFTYVIGFGSMLIIARTGQFPTAIPDDLAILAGGSLATFVVSKAIQTQADASKRLPATAGTVPAQVQGEQASTGRGPAAGG